MSIQTEKISGIEHFRAVLFAGGGAIAIGLVSLIGWIAGIPYLATWGNGNVPIAPDAVLLLIVLGSVMIARCRVAAESMSGRFIFVTSVLVTLYSFLKFAGFLFGIDLLFEDLYNPIIGYSGHYPLNRMSPVASVLFFCVSIAFVLHDFKPPSLLRRNLAAGFGAFALLAGFVSFTGYVYSEPFLYGNMIRPIALSASFAVMLLGAGVLALSGNSIIIVRDFSGTSWSARLLRAIIPVVGLSVYMSGLMGQYFDASDSSVQALFSALFVIVFCIIASAVVLHRSRGTIRLFETYADALAKSEERFRSIFNNSADEVMIHDPQGRFLVVNDTTCRKLKYTRDELLSMTVAQIDGPVDVDLFAKRVAALLKDGFMLCETSHKTRDGSVYPVEINARVIEYNGGPAVLGIARDISLRKKIEAERDINRMQLEELNRTLEKRVDERTVELQKSKDLLDSLSHEIPGFLFQALVSPDGHVSVPYASYGMYEMYGLTLDEVRVDASPLFSKIHTDDLSVFAKTMLGSIRSQLPWKVDFRVVLDKNRIEWRSVMARPRLLEDGCTLLHGIVSDITSFKDIDERLRKSEIRYRQLVEAVTSYIYTVTIEEGRAVSTVHAPSCVSVTGYTAEEFANDPHLWISITNVDDRDAIVEAVGGVIRHGLGTTIEHRIRHKNGTVRWIKDTMVPRVDESGTLVAYDGLISDITVQKNAEQTVKLYSQELEAQVRERTEKLAVTNTMLQESNNELEQKRVALENSLASLANSEDQLRLLLDSTAEAIYGIDTEGRCTFCNAACVSMLGYTNAIDLIGYNMHRKIHHSSIDGVPIPVESCHICQSIHSGVGTYSADEVLWRADGTSFSVEYWSYPQVRDGRVIGAVVTFIDITEKKVAHDRLLKLSLAVENSPATVLIADKNGRIEYVNPKFTEETGYTAEEAIGKNPRILNAHVLPQSFYEDLWHTILSGQEWHGILCNRKKNGTLFWEQASISPVKNDAGDIVNFVAVKEDITDRKRIEEELARAKEAADAASAAKTRFIANMSHEIRTPLNAIIGFSSLAMRSGLPPEQREYVGLIEKAGSSLLYIVNDILDFSKIEAGAMSIESEHFDLHEMVGTVMAVLGQRAQEKKIALSVDMVRTISRDLVGDAHRLSQVLTNLIGNAIKFTEFGSVRVAVREILKDDSVARIQFCVSDSGIGISPEAQARLFNPFVQADGSTTRCFGGTGLGLSISKRLVELMGGAITVESTPLQGSTFCVEIPFARAAELPNTVEPVANVGASSPAENSVIDTRGNVSGALGTNFSRFDFSGHRILLAEDQPINRRLALEVLKSTGLVVDVAENGREAVDRVLQGDVAYDLILMDVEMPEMDGYEATTIIRKESRFVDLPIIAMTAHAFDDARLHIADVGMNGCLTKPLDIDLLYATLEEYFTHGVILGATSESNVVDKNEYLLDAPEIHGLDTVNAVRRLGGDVELYRWALAEFVAKNRSAVDDIDAACTAGDYSTAARIAHSVKGNAGSIGATTLAGSAQDLFDCFVENQPDTVRAPVTARFAEELTRIIIAIQASGVVAAIHAGPDSLEHSRLQEIEPVLKQLFVLLDECDGSAARFFERSRKQLSQLSADRVAQLHDQIVQFAYDDAIMTLQEIAASCGLAPFCRRGRS